MPSIQSSTFPLAFKVAPSVPLPQAYGHDSTEIAIRTVTRALEGMQKEAIVHNDFTKTAWRMVCDEGPWLNGTDLSSFPLGFFSAGMAASLASEIIALAKQRDIRIDGLKIIQDANYALEGSAIRKTMTGFALPIESEILIESGAPKADLQKLVYHGLAASPADAVMRTKLESRFRITHNNQDIGVGETTAATTISAADPVELFDQIAPADSGMFAQDIIEKLDGADTSAQRAGSDATGHAKEQKRAIQVRAVLELREDGLKSIQTQCIQPAGGSVFNFLSDDSEAFGGQGRAPTGLDYISAGVSFCYMTQLGRFADIIKQDLQAYGVVQDTRFSLPGASAQLNEAATAQSVDTHVFLTSDDDDEANQILVQMGEQTCYLHACYRGAVKTRLHVRTM